MDPITLSILFGAGALIGYATQQSAREQAEDKTIMLARLYQTTDGWLCTELASHEALNLVGQIMDLNLLAWWPKVKSGCYKVIIVTHPGGPLNQHIIVLLESAGSYGWYLNQAHRYGYRKVTQRIDYQRINDLIDFLNKDPAEEVATTASQIMDPVRRYKYLRYALTANPRLSALLSKSDDFLRVTRACVETPEVRQLKERKHQKQLPEQEYRMLPVFEEVAVEEKERVPAWATTP